MAERLQVPTDSDHTRTTALICGFKTVRDSFTGGSKFAALTQINVYTDGSRGDGRVGAGFLINEGRAAFLTGECPLPPHLSLIHI